MHVNPGHPAPHSAIPSATTLLGATLCLMTCAWRGGHATQPDADCADRIADNLLTLSRHPGIDATMQRVCHLLFEQWEAVANGAPSAAPPPAKPSRLCPLDARIAH